MSNEGGLTFHYEDGGEDRTESLDRLLGALADGTRRTAVAYLAEVGRPVSRDNLVAHVVANAPGPAGGDAPGAGRRERVTAAFHHNHLPRLADAGLVYYDPDEAVVAPTENVSRVVACLSGLDDVDGHST